jgi:hypothetical protein
MPRTNWKSLRLMSCTVSRDDRDGTLLNLLLLVFLRCQVHHWLLHGESCIHQLLLMQLLLQVLKLSELIGGELRCLLNWAAHN